jgi:hypothetical protein
VSKHVETYRNIRRGADSLKFQNFSEIGKLVAESPKRWCHGDGHVVVSYGTQNAFRFLSREVGLHGSSGEQQPFKAYLQHQHES